MTLMDGLNIVAGIASIIGLGFSFWITYRTGKIQKAIELQHLSEDFNIQRQDIMDDLRSSGLNAVRNEFQDGKSLISDFRFRLLSYSKEYNDILSNEEKSHIQKMLELLDSSPEVLPNDNERQFLFLLDQITSKPRIRRI